MADLKRKAKTVQIMTELHLMYFFGGTQANSEKENLSSLNRN